MTIDDRVTQLDQGDSRGHSALSERGRCAASTMETVMSTPIPDLPPMSDYESTRRDFALHVPEHYNFGFDLIDRRAREADKVAFIAVDRSGERVESHRFSDLRRASNRFARALLALGAEKGDFALVIIPRIPAWYEVLVGCTKVGVVAMPGTNLLTAKDIEYRINKAGARIAIVTAEHLDKIEEVRPRCPTLLHVVAVGAEDRRALSYEQACARQSDRLEAGELPPSRAEEPMLVYFTSGTTSMPKMVSRDHAYAHAHAITGRYWMDLREEDIHWTLSDTGWAKAAWGMVYPPWQMGATTVLYDGDTRFDADAHLKLIGRLGVTTFCAPPTVYRLFAQIDLGRYELGSLRHCMSAGEPLNPEAMRVWREATGTEIHDGYGQTETINVVANFPCLPIRPGSMGKPVPGFDVGVVDDEGRPVPEGQIGHIALRSDQPHPPGLFHGYHLDAASTNASFRHGWYYTGDTATRDEDGYIWFVGRADDIISSAGYRISPFEVESALTEHPAIAESAVVAAPDALRGEVVKAYVVLASGFEPSDELAADIQDFVKRQTAPYKYPRTVEFRDALPKTISGKIRRVELREESAT